MKKSGRGRRRAVIALPVAALALSLPFIASPSAGASTRSALTAPATATAAGSGSGSGGQTIEKNQETLDKIAGRITEGLSESDRARIPGFTDIEVDSLHNSLRLHWKGDPPQRVRRILAHLPEGVHASVLPARYSKADLHAARNRLLHGGKPADLRVSGTSTPLRITSIAPAVDGSGLRIGYDEDRGVGKSDRMDPLASAARQDRSSEVKAATDRLTGVRTTVAYQPLSVDLSSRQEDDTPWHGGAALRNPGGGVCSSAFSVKTSTGRYELSAAYHCDGSGGVWHTYWGNRLIGTTDTAQRLASDDALGISLPSGQSAGRLYDGPANETDGYSKPVSGWGHNNVGDYVCTDGANSGVHCGVQISATDIGVTGANGVYRPDTDLAYSTSRTKDHIAAANGDSGGPVFAGVNNYTSDEARGMITALDRTVTCPSSEYVLDSGVRTPWCVQGVYFVPIFQTLQDMHWTLVTQ
ncbi:S1 family peptidase [Streptomyces camelliae]|uniref:S1 family peptidase n=1 Tax=Streptomyces camelliae TaxID=3004093 RepID=A0ABY7P5Z4_9ACTN|nr:S1 family peptidase [Streptomyces sp. HUAS 2-6]WBO65976.1 S1 family peptidase [Streptomyces sp. HUAS 2-6]